MSDSKPKSIYLKDYKKPAYYIPRIDLCFDIDDAETKVTSVMQIKRNLDLDTKEALKLNGVELKLISIKIDNKLLTGSEFKVSNEFLTISNVPDEFILTIENSINPAENKSLEGLYKSGTLFCTQNEPEGFRKITYFIDRPDVMSKYTTKIIANKSKYPVLLSNGNPLESGELEKDKHWIKWEDPFLKPSYLFALVAGDLGMIQDEYITITGRKIDLRLYCDKGNENKCYHGMESLKKSMKWDEDTFGRECDLDIYMIVAVDAFNMGAMENKGLNIFNTKRVLVNPKTATDADFQDVEAVIGHEYFHNWTGNRITCRDWFQLTLKEGLTVFRDQEFSSDMSSRPVQRISDVRVIRDRQFEEDMGPMAHPIQPKSYIEMNNFYTLTVYDKGSEVIRMIHTLIGKKAFRKGMDKYFELYDGMAVTVNEFVNAMELASGHDLSHFMKWYDQAGTPEIHVEFNYNEDKKTFSLNLKQTCPETPDQKEKDPFYMPFNVGLLDNNGNDMPLKLADKDNDKQETTKQLILTKKEQSFTFENITQKPIASLNRNFSAPVKVFAPLRDIDYITLMSKDSDDFNKWDSSQYLAKSIVNKLVIDYKQQNILSLSDDYLNAIETILKDSSLDNSLKSLLLTLPEEAVLSQGMKPIDFDLFHMIRNFVKNEIAKKHQDLLLNIYNENTEDKKYSLDQVSIGKRAIKNCCLSYLMTLNDNSVSNICYNQLLNASNMTDEIQALFLMSYYNDSKKDESVKVFYEKWKHDTLVMNKWLSVQAIAPHKDTLNSVKALMNDPIFDMNMPNLVRSLLGMFTMNRTCFHAENGEGYDFISDIIIKLNSINPAIASGLSSSFNLYAYVNENRQAKMKQAMEKIMAISDLSKNVFEKISKTLG